MAAYVSSSYTNLTPDISITRSDMTKLLLASIDLREIGIAQIINTEAKWSDFIQEKLGLKTPLTVEEILKVAESVQNTLGRISFRKNFFVLERAVCHTSCPDRRSIQTLFYTSWKNGLFPYFPFIINIK